VVKESFLDLVVNSWNFFNSSLIHHHFSVLVSSLEITVHLLSSIMEGWWSTCWCTVIVILVNGNASQQSQNDGVENTNEK